ncbi:MAG: MoxR family ATPase [Candidatus Mcinerneyibacterium aminivorans]|jgi:MoxR-like ATPase|uniref:MoxR family ATPase n=1 Tax=Candidatus Mcinerneyibacterium aminivorans TaxID=2703815 RepID=A0A5D0MKB4_9BACT|nr:MAG: MoxR family ATPase [Candidatus Mcinerneyibacterium aminivorans]
MDLKEINAKIEEKSSFVNTLNTEIHKKIIGQDYMIRRILIALFTNGHILVEGVPGLAKTLTIDTIARIISLDFKRIQFTPDLLPADLTGGLIYNEQNKEFEPKKGPIFTNILLADEVNRAPAKVQAAMLESMQEKQVTLGNTTLELPSPFFVLATQNPIEQEGTYQLPEAQMDRFMLKLKVDYPNKSQEREIMDLHGVNRNIELNQILKPEDIIDIRETIDNLYVEDSIKDYILNIVFATRDPERYGLSELANYIDFGASPRASIYILKAAKASAFLNRRGYVVPDDIKEIAKDVLRHRTILSFEAEAENIDSDNVIEEILANIEVP